MNNTRNKFRVLWDLKKDVISIEQAQVELETTEKAVKMMLTIWSPHLAKIVRIMNRIEKAQDTYEGVVKLKTELAETLNVTLRQANRLINEGKVVVPPPKTLQKRLDSTENAKKRWELHRKHAFDVIAGLSTPEDACVPAEVSSRQMYRVCNNLLSRVGLSLRDLGRETLPQRERVVKLIEKELKEEHA